MSDPSPAAVAARYERIAAERAANGDHRRHLGREESLALLDQLWGPIPDDAMAWADGLFADDPAT